MWSFILYSVTFLQWRVFDQYEHTLRPGKGRWDFHMEEKIVTQEEIQQQNEAAAAKAPVRSVTAGGSTDTEPEDLFLRGFNDGI